MRQCLTFLVGTDTGSTKAVRLAKSRHDISVVVAYCAFNSTKGFMILCYSSSHSLSLSLSSYLGCRALLMWLPFFHSLLRSILFLALRVLYVVILCLFCFCLSSASRVSLLNRFLATMSFAGYFHIRFLLSAFFPICLFCFVFSDRARSRFVLCNFLYLVTTAGIVADSSIM